MKITLTSGGWCRSKKREKFIKLSRSKKHYNVDTNFKRCIIMNHICKSIVGAAKARKPIKII